MSIASSESMISEEPSRTVGRYTIGGPIASGGMASIHYGRFSVLGFAKTVAIKRLLPGRALDPAFSIMLMDEAKVASRIQHPNVVQTLDVIQDGDEILLVLEYVRGESLKQLLATLETRAERMPAPIAASIVCGALRGVHAAHEAKDEHGEPLALVHRDLTPSNILVDINGAPRVLDFGIAKARGRSQQPTQVGLLKGTPGYIAPEQVHGNASRRSDVFSMGIVLWEALVGERLFTGSTSGALLAAVLSKRIEPPSARRNDVPKALDAVVLKSLARDAAQRYATALDMMRAIEASLPVASPTEVAAWLETTMADSLDEQQRKLAEVERELPAVVLDTPLVDGAAAPRRETGPSRRGVVSSGARDPRRVLALVVTLAGAVMLLLTFAGPRDTRSRPPEAPIARTTTPVPPVESAPPIAEPSSPPARPSAVRAEHRSHARPPRSTPDCNPPYTVDGNNVRTWKRECF
jgi:eukaryotic-like serine/threonine-protein kinase